MSKGERQQIDLLFFMCTEMEWTNEMLSYHFSFLNNIQKYNNVAFLDNVVII